MRVSCLGKSLRDERLDLLLLKEFKQGDQILSKQCRFQPFERLDAEFTLKNSTQNKRALWQSRVLRLGSDEVEVPADVYFFGVLNSASNLANSGRC